MFRKSMEYMVLAAVLAALAGLPGIASAQTTNPVLVDYYTIGRGSGAFDGVLRISNFGSVAGGPAPGGDLCAMIYVFDDKEELQECCGCLVTADDLKTLQVSSDLTDNPSNGVPLTTGPIKILSSPRNGAGVCDPSFGGPGKALVLQGDLAAWGTHVQNDPRGRFFVTETPAQTELASTVDLIRISTTLCGALLGNSSGRGRCTCGTGL